MKIFAMRLPLAVNVLALSLLVMASCNAQPADTTNRTVHSGSSKETGYNKLTEQEQRVLLEKATDRPYTGDYYEKKDRGIYICRQCNNPLYTSGDKFDSHCGWPSFDDEIDGSVTKIPDADGQRTEIVCNNCHGHLGHVFAGEGFTDKDTRHCVNTSSIVFIPAAEVKNAPKVIVLKH